MLDQKSVHEELNYLRARVDNLEKILNTKRSIDVQRWYSPQEAATQLNISKALVLRMLDAGELKFWKSIGGHRKIYGESLNSYLENVASTTGNKVNN